jgi:NADPH-dependent curcumin reductase CurA
MTNYAWVIAKPDRGGYSSDCLRWEEREVSPLSDGEVLVRTLFLSLDPTSLNWLKLEPSYTFLPLAVGHVMLGAAVGVVEESRSAGFTPGHLVQGMWGGELYSKARSGAAGATGSLAAQIAKALGARVIGIASGEVKCRLLIDTFKLDGAIDYKTGDLGVALSKECPQGVDLFFDNVGGSVLDAVLANMAMGARIVICGAMSQYNLADPKDAYGCKNLPLMLFRRARMEGFLGSAGGRETEFEALLHQLYAEGKLLNRSHIIDGLENAPQALKLLLTGQNDGKLMVRVSRLQQLPAGAGKDERSTVSWDQFHEEIMDVVSPNGIHSAGGSSMFSERLQEKKA